MDFWLKIVGRGLCIILLLSSCKKEQKTIALEPEEFELQIPPGFPEMVFPVDNQFSLSRWKLGKKLFFDPILSRDSSISCASCHKQHLAFADELALSPGIKNRAGTRNATALGNIGFHPYYLREGSLPSLEMQVLVPVEEHNEFDHSMLEISEKLRKSADYTSMSFEAYNREPDPWVLSRALGVFQRSLISGNSPYDRFTYQGKHDALNDSQKRGMALFFSSQTQCSKCHSGFNFSNYAFENNGLDSIYADPLRMRFSNNPADAGKTKVPSLRNIGFSAPYMHDGRFKTLSQVLDHYQSGGNSHPNQSLLVRPFTLNSQEKEDLLSFLLSLNDSSFTSNPFFGDPNQ